MKKVSHIQIFKKIFKLLSTRRKKVMFVFFLLSIIGAFAEIASISILIPFIDLVIDPEKIYNYLDKFDLEINLEKYSDNLLLLFITIIFISAIIFSSLVKKNNLENKNIGIEITESNKIKANKNILDTLLNPKANKFLIAMNDFDTGYANIKRLTIFAVDTVKLDKLSISGIKNKKHNN